MSVTLGFMMYSSDRTQSMKPRVIDITIIYIYIYGVGCGVRACVRACCWTAVFHLSMFD